MLVVFIVVGLLGSLGILPQSMVDWAATGVAQIVISSGTIVAAPTSVGGTAPVAATAIPRTLAPGRPANWLTVYFTDPATSQQRNILDTAVLPVITRARRTLDVASFDLNLPKAIQALIDAKNRGVAVRVVTDGTHGATILDADKNGGVTFDAIKTLKAAGIAIADGGRSNGLMHNKIIIADGATLFIGSWNMSYNDTFRNNNNLLKITEPRLIANYQAEFDDMFVNKTFGAKSQLRAMQPVMTIDGTPVENYFAPRDRVMDKVVQEANKARHSIKFMIFTYTDQDLAKQMVSQAKLGVDVQGVIEARGASQGAMPTLFCAKQKMLQVRTDGNSATMHHKVIIIDDETVITGSFNFTRSADTANDDSLVIIRNPNVAALYITEFNKVFAEGKTPTSVKC
jgi:phosphatidylserine/phosphatidylglycerophosphate/cardiolipin synthase-like enzyme